MVNRGAERFDRLRRACYVLIRPAPHTYLGRLTIPSLVLFLLASPLKNLFDQIGWVAGIVLAFLLAFSLISWAIIFQKLRQFSAIQAQTASFLRAFRTSARPDARSISAAAAESPLAAVFLAGTRELESQIGGTNPGTHRVRSLNAITAAMQLASTEEIRKVEKYLPWLATTGSVSPFIGLFGTVWGVINAFAGLGEAGAASLRAVAPGIADALTATAAGLFAAIPAVIAYNHFLHNVKDLGTRMDNFTLEFAAQVEKLYTS